MDDVIWQSQNNVMQILSLDSGRVNIFKKSKDL